MSRGGKRPGAGRPKGAKHKITESVIREAAKAGVTPLEYMLDVMRTMADQDPDRADRMAIAAAPYVHVKKKETTEAGGVTINITPFEAGIG
jgi:hypothetical protein